MILRSSSIAFRSLPIEEVCSKIKEKDGSYAISCSALGVYTVGKTLAEARKNFRDALELHLSVLKERAIEAVA
jgi:predicted RNase H-like HicB family nuclease